MKIIAIIPARYASTRFPGKPLAILGGKSVIERVYEQVSSMVSATYVATDDTRIRDAVEAFGGQAVMTSSAHQSGTDRIAEAISIIGGDFDVVINVQGDEPFIHPSQITTLCNCFDDAETQIATLGKPFTDMDSVSNPNSPKIVVDNRGFALYFSRSIIPFVRNAEPSTWLSHYPFLKHLGIYAYRSDVLQSITRLPQSSLEKAESLEQLRWLQNGYRIRVGVTDIETVGIDTPEDLQRAEEFLLQRDAEKSID
jgi:3-deoxy-manno-octulosonate cytidylyltransferase (CMP-KDO synthetase)